jgi:hypothetical protein
VCVGKIAALLQTFGLSVGSCRFANVLQCGCGFFLLFLRGEEKKQNKFPSNLHYPVKKLNPFLF